jgi:hypothetical protein
MGVCRYKCQLFGIKANICWNSPCIKQTQCPKRQ